MTPSARYRKARLAPPPSPPKPALKVRLTRHEKAVLKDGIHGAWPSSASAKAMCRRLVERRLMSRRNRSAPFRTTAAGLRALWDAWRYVDAPARVSDAASPLVVRRARPDFNLLPAGGS